MLGGNAPPRPALGPENHRHGGLAAEHVAVLPGLVDELVHGDGHEIEVHDLGHRAHAGHRRPDGRSGDGRLTDGRVADAILAELVQQATGRPVRPAVDGHVLTHDEDSRVAPHLLGDGLLDRFTIKHFRHLTSFSPLSPLSSRPSIAQSQAGRIAPGSFLTSPPAPDHTCPGSIRRRRLRGPPRAAGIGFPRGQTSRPRPSPDPPPPQSRRPPGRS